MEGYHNIHSNIAINAIFHVLQDLLNNEFAKSTVILVAHRLSTVLNCCSRVVVMSFGRIVEEGDPKELARDLNSHFYKMLHSKAAHSSA